MSWARDEVLFRAQNRPLGLRAVRNLVSRENPGADREAVQRAAADLARSLVDDGFAILGDRTPTGFVPSTTANLVGSDGWLQLTDAGRAAARNVALDASDESETAVKQWDWPLAQAAAQVLVYGTIDWVELGQIHWRVKEVSPDVPIGEVQQRTLDLIAELVGGGLALVGSIDTGAEGFVPWDCPVQEAISRIRTVYVDGFDDESVWEWFCVLELTRKGTVLAGAIEAQTRT
jgi:hypothetical protein